MSKRTTQHLHKFPGDCKPPFSSSDIAKVSSPLNETKPDPFNDFDMNTYNQTRIFHCRFYEPFYEHPQTPGFRPKEMLSRKQYDKPKEECTAKELVTKRLDYLGLPLQIVTIGDVYCFLRCKGNELNTPLFCKQWGRVGITWCG